MPYLTIPESFNKQID